MTEQDPTAEASQVSRRKFVQSVGAVAATTGLVGVASASDASASAAAQAPPGSGKGRRVAVFGGGPGGMTAAHELAQRGFQVDLYERHDVLGGKVRSFSIPNTGTGGRADLPGELGPHFYYGAYQNLGETLGRIPTGGGHTVLDNLTFGPPDVRAVAGWDGTAIKVPLPSTHRPIEGFEPQDLLKLITNGLTTLGKLTPFDVALLASKLVAIATSGPKRQWGQLEHLSFADYLHARRLSPNGKKLLRVLMEQNTEPAERMNARVMGCGCIHHFALDAATRGWGPGFNQFVTIMNGPANETWFDPWAAQLRRLGTRIHTGQRLTALACEGRRITGATVRDATGRETAVDADWYVLAVPMDKAAELMNPRLVAADPALGKIAKLEQSLLGAMQIYLKKPEPKLEALGATIGQPWLIAWQQNGFQSGFWKRNLPAQYGDGTVATNLSVDMASWDSPGILYGKTALQCTAAEMFAEIRAQIRLELGDKTILPDSYIHSWLASPALIREGRGPARHDEPDFAATPGCWQNQPEAVTKIPNLFLAASYIRTTAGIEGMDSANEAGKKAANGILAASKLPGSPAPVASSAVPPALKPFWDDDDRRYALGLPNAFDIIAPTPR